MRAVIDTTVIIAYYNKDDENHLQATRLMQAADKGDFGTLILPEYVFDEAVTLALARKGKSSAESLGKWMLNSQFALAYSDEHSFGQAWALFAKTSQLSFTDCFIAASALKLAAPVITFDSHFKSIPGLKVIS